VDVDGDDVVERRIHAPTVPRPLKAATRQSISGAMRLTVSLVLSVLAIAGAVFYASESQRQVADENYAEAIVARQLSADMLSRENLLHEFLADGRTETAASIYELERRQASTLDRARKLSSDSPAELDTLVRQSAAADRWNEFARTTITGRSAPSRDYAAAREKAVTDFLDANRDYQRALDTRRVDELAAAALVPVKLMVTLSIMFGAIAVALIARRRRSRAAVLAREIEREDAERGYAESQARFGEAMQVAENQGEGHALLIRHLETGAPDAKITVLIRNNSGDRLEPAVPLPADSALTEPLEHAKPRSCLAVRLSRPVDQGPSSREILACEVCGAQEGESTCQPLLVGGEVIGSVLTNAQHAATDAERRRTHDSVTQAAPVLANLRNLALAELRAATDALTGLPNRRAIDDHLKRLLAQAGRSLTPMSAILLDLDHFKEINDTFGHERGDEVLAAVGALMRSELRGSDFAGRSGGEEFIVMVPDTDRAGALRVAEHLRQAMHSLSLPGVTRAITASFGVATFPDDALDGETLMRLADRALYVAKQSGRDRVEATSSAGLGLRRRAAETPS
jgi:diguanylate cyclase (GGDEF)-like protein